MSDAIAALGMKFQRSTDGGTNYSDIAELMDINLGVKADEIDVTNHGSGAFHEKIISLLDLSVGIDISFVPGNSGHSFSSGMAADMLARTKRFYRIRDPLGNILCTFQAFINDFQLKGQATDSLKASVQFSNNGTPTFGS